MAPPLDEEAYGLPPSSPPLLLELEPPDPLLPPPLLVAGWVQEQLPRPLPSERHTWKPEQPPGPAQGSERPGTHTRAAAASSMRDTATALPPHCAVRIATHAAQSAPQNAPKPRARVGVELPIPTRIPRWPTADTA